MDLKKELGDWYPILKDEFTKPYMETIGKFIGYHKNKLEPCLEDVFKAFRLTPPDKVKVVIIGQDPYPDGSADGLAFSCQTHIPYSLSIIFTELEYEGFGRREKHTLDDWAEQGVLLLNRYLTTGRGSMKAHAGIGWDEFTNAVIIAIKQFRQPIVTALWGSDAQQLSSMTGSPVGARSLVTSDHPAAMRYQYGKRPFIGNNHFKLINYFLNRHNAGAIVWNRDKAEPSKASLGQTLTELSQNSGKYQIPHNESSLAPI